MTTHPTALRLDFHGTRLDLEVEPGAGIEDALAFHGQYQGFFSLGHGAATAVAPALIAALCLGDRPQEGRLVLGILFAAAGAAAPPALRVRGAVREPYPSGARE
ncbi:hypothetical protein FB563_6657 [Streptomyces puniciscabiei]|uniref:Uncharacterized protein n=1 Tax=Streptomyces puniciscabiei TaxID=164348 RepID=A0A542TI52_9ACTN|nr:hypothetical protein [Streptomyces puniciscabiei]TQK86516.1 hypothetical protein FB563_6657 [Streptomyces puniciscabiei]